MDRNGLFNPTLASGGNNKVVYEVIDPNGCAGKDSIEILVNPLPDANIANPGNLCDGPDDIQLQGETNQGELFIPQGYITADGIFSSTIAGVGNHLVEYEVTDLNGCTNRGARLVTIDALPYASIQLPGIICQNDAPITIFANTLGGQFSATPYLDAAGNFAPTMASIGLNKAVYTLNSANGCTNKDSIEIEVHSLPTNTITLNQDRGCEGFTLELSTESNKITDWNINGDNYTLNDISLVLPVGDHTVALQVEDEFGCATSLDTFITIFSNPIADFEISNEKVYISKPEVDLYDRSRGEIVSWSWELGDNGNATQQDLSYRYADTGNLQSHCEWKMLMDASILKAKTSKFWQNSLHLFQIVSLQMMMVKMMYFAL